MLAWSSAASCARARPLRRCCLVWSKRARTAHSSKVNKRFARSRAGGAGARGEARQPAATGAGRSEAENGDDEFSLSYVVPLYGPRLRNYL